MKNHTLKCTILFYRNRNLIQEKKNENSKQMTISCCIHCWFMCPRLCLFFTRVDQKKKAPTHKMPLYMMITRSSNKNFEKEGKRILCM